MKYIEVMVSAYYRGEAFEDVKSNTQFELPESKIKIYAIPTTSDLSGIASLIRKNQLVLVSGELPKEEKKEVKEVAKEEPKEETKQEVKEEAVEVEVPAEEVKLEDLDMAALKALADEKGVQYKGNISKAALLKKLK